MRRRERRIARDAEILQRHLVRLGQLLGGIGAGDEIAVIRRGEAAQIHAIHGHGIQVRAVALLHDAGTHGVLAFLTREPGAGSQREFFTEVPVGFAKDRRAAVLDVLHAVLAPTRSAISP